MDGRPACVAHGQAADLVPPGQRALPPPAIPSQALARLDALVGDPPGNAAAPQVFPSPLGIVGLVRVPLGRALPRAPQRPLIGSVASPLIANRVTSFTVTAEGHMASGIPWASTTTGCFVPGLPRSIGCRLEASLPFWPGPSRGPGLRATH